MKEFSLMKLYYTTICAFSSQLASWLIHWLKDKITLYYRIYPNQITDVHLIKKFDVVIEPEASSSSSHKHAIGTCPTEPSSGINV
jgi:hypothetical protein